MNQPVKILVVEDHELLKEQIEALLSEFYIVKAVTHGEEGLRIARENQPDLIICDIMLPDISGYDVLQQIRADQQLFNTPVILLTALEAEDNIIKGWDVGADDYITKPFKAKQLISRIDNLINLRRLLKQQHQVTFSSTSTKDPYLKKLYYFLENNLDNENLSVNDIATYMGGSISSTERQIKKLTSLSPVKLITRFRLEKAREIIKDQPSLSIKEVAYQTGFGSLSYFSKVYKDYYGVKPNTDRRL